MKEFEADRDRTYNTRINKSRIISWTVVAIWMAVIFRFSAQNAVESNGLSEGFTVLLARLFSFIFPIDLEASTTQIYIDRLNDIIRTCAHGTVFLVLALLVYNALRKSGAAGKSSAGNGTAGKSSAGNGTAGENSAGSGAKSSAGIGAAGIKTLVFSLVICAVYALTDEIHQLYVPGRAFQLFDIAVDCTGALIGCLIMNAVAVKKLPAVDSRQLFITKRSDAS